MFIFAFIGLCITASIAGLLWYKISQEDDVTWIDDNDEVLTDDEHESMLSSLPDDWEDYKAQYSSPDEYNTHPEA